MRKKINGRKPLRMGKFAVKCLSVALIIAQLLLFVPPKPAAALPNPLDLANEIGNEVLNMLPIESYKTSVERIINGADPFVQVGKEVLAEASKASRFLVCQMMNFTQLPGQLIDGNFDAIITPDCAQWGLAAAGLPSDQQKENSDQLVQILSTGDAAQAIDILKLAPIDVNVGIDLPENAGKAWVKKQGTNVAVCVWIHSGAAAALFGISNEDNLCGGKTDNLANEGNVLTAFLDITLDGYGYIYTSLPIGASMPHFSAVGYAPLLNNKYFKLELGALKNTKVSAEFSVGLAATVDAEISVEGEASASLSAEVDPEHLVRVVNGASKRMMEAIYAVSARGIMKEDGQILLRPEDATNVLMAALNYVREYDAGEPGSIGSVSIGADLTGSLGIGVADTVWPLASGTGALSYEVPADRLVNISAEVLQSFLEAATTSGESFLKLGSAALAGQPISSITDEAKATLVNAWNTELKPALEASFGGAGAMFGDSTLKSEITVNFLGAGGSGDPDNSSTSVEVYRLAASIPIVTAVSAGFDPQFWTDVANVLPSILPSGLKQILYNDMSPPAYDPDVFGTVPDDTVFTVTAAPLIPIIQVYADFSAKALMDLLAVGLVAASNFADTLVASAVSGSLAPFETQNIVDTLNQLQKDARDDIVIGFKTGLGANGSLGAEVEMEIGAGASLYGNFNLEMLLVLASLGTLDESEAEGHAIVGFDVTGDISAGVSLGEVAEFSANGGLSANTTLLSLELSEVSGVRPAHIAYVPESSDAFLQSLAIGQGLALNEPFAPSTYFYTADIPYEYDHNQFDVRAQTNHAYAKLKINGADYVSGSPYLVNLGPSGVNLIEFKVVSMDGSQSKTYYIEARRKSNTKLKSLQIVKPGAFSIDYIPVETGTTFTYQVNSEVNFVGLTAEAANPYASMTINGTSTNKMGLFLLPGINTYTITVSSADGTMPGGVRQTTYTLKIERLKSSRADLVNLTVGGSNYFDGGTFTSSKQSYTKKVPTNVTHIDVRPETQFLTETTITVNGNTVSSGGTVRIPLAYGSNTIKVKVVAENGVQTKEYVVTVTRETVRRLTNLQVTGGAQLSQAFDPAKIAQKLTIIDSAKPYYFMGTYDAAAGGNSFIRYYGTVDVQGGVWSAGQAPIVNNTLPVVLWSLTGGGEWNRTPYLFVMPDANASANANLSGLKLAAGGVGELALSPAFQKNTTNYTVATSSPVLQVTPTKENPFATVFVNGEYNSSGTYSVNLVEGMNDITIAVVAQNGTQKTYKVSAEYKNPFKNADLASISCIGCWTNIQNFNGNTTTYTVDVPNNTGGVTISAQAAVRNFGPNQLGATIAIADFTNMQYFAEHTKGFNTLQIPRSGLAPGINTIKIVVASMDGYVEKVYTVKMNLLPATDSALKQLKVLNKTGTAELFGSAFTPGKLDYSLSVNADVDNVLIRALPNHTEAMIKINGKTWSGNTDFPVFLLPGNNKIEIEVTAQDGITKKTYTIDIRRKDAVMPTLSLPENMRIEATSRSGAAVNFSVQASDAVDGPLTPICSRVSGSVFALGTTNVSCTATDLDGNMASGSFTVTVEDTTPPVLNGLNDLTIPAGVTVNFAISATDAVDTAPTLACTRKSGELLQLGSTRVSCVATDFSGNASYGDFYVAVTDSAPPEWADGSELQAAQITPDSISLYWPLATDIAGVKEYRVYRKQGSDLTLLAEVDKPAHLVAGLEEKIAYTFVVMAGDTLGNWTPVGLTGTFATTETADTTAPTWPTGKVVEAACVADCETNLMLKWSPADDNRGVSQYRVYVNDGLVATIPVSGLTWNGSTYEYSLTGLLPGTNYSFKIEAGDAAQNWSIYGPSTIAATQAGAPAAQAPTWPDGSALTYSFEGTTILVLHWTPAVAETGVSQYRIYRYGILQDTIPASALTVTESTYSYSVAGLSPLQTYQFRVEAGDDASNWSNSGPSVTMLFPGTMPTPPEPEAPDMLAPTWPSGSALTASDITDTSLTLNWTPAADNKGVSSYGIYKNDILFATVSAADLTVTESTYGYQVTNLTPSATYTFKVIAGDAAQNWSADGPTVSATTAASTPTDPGGAPEGMDTLAPTWPSASLTLSEITEKGLHLLWSAASDNVAVIGYRIYVNGVNAGEVDGSATQFDLVDLQPSTNYIFNVEAADAAGNWSTGGPFATATTLASTSMNPPDEGAGNPLAPTWPESSSLTAANVGMHELNLSWSEAGDSQSVAAYRIYVNGNLFTEVGADVLTYHMVGLQPDYLYTFKIEAGNAEGQWSSDGPQLTVNTLTDPNLETVDRLAPFWPLGSTATVSNIGETDVHLEWTPASDDTSVQWYRIYQNGLVAATIPGDSANYDMQELQPGASYVFKVEAGDASGNWSNNGPQIGVTTSKASPISEPGIDFKEDSPEAAKDERRTVGASELESGNDRKVTIALEDGQIGLLVPIDAGQLLGDDTLEITAEGVTLAIPPAVLSALADSIGSESGDDAQIGITVKKIAQTDSPSTSGAGGNNSEVRNYGVYEFELSIVNKDGETLDHHLFKQPLKIVIPYDGDNVNADLLGVYSYNPETESWEYIGGTADPNSRTISVYLPHFSTYAVLEWDKTFADVPENHWVYSTLKALSAKHMISGVSDSQFAPNAKTTRAEFVALLTRILGLKSADNAKFGDIDPSKWYANAVAAAVEAGLAAGKSADTFAPDDPISREEMAAMLVRAYEYKAGRKATERELVFSDREHISNWASEYVRAAVGEELMRGVGGNRFAPSSSVTRAEAAQAIYNLLQK